jgi:acetyl esterase
VRDETEVRPDVRVVLDYLAGAETEATEEREPATARASMLESVRLADLPTGPIAVSRNLTVPGPGGDLPALLLDPRDTRVAGPLVIWFHGGGFVTGDIETHRSLCAEAARQLDLPVLLVGYRLAPEAPFPAAHDDAEAVCRWAAQNPAELELEISGLVLGGDSAGGNLTVTTTIALRDRPAAVPVLAQLAVYPSTDATRTYPSERTFAEGYLLTEAGKRWYRKHNRITPDDLRASPINADLADLPPAVIMTAGCDPNRDEGRAFAAALVQAGVPTTYLEAVGNVHAFVILRGAVPSSQADIRTALDALRDVLSRSA